MGGGRTSIFELEIDDDEEVSGGEGVNSQFEQGALRSIRGFRGDGFDFTDEKIAGEI